MLRTVPPGADVYFDGQLVGKSPLLLRYNPFRRFRLTVRKTGFRDYSCGDGTSIPQCIEFTKDWLLTVSLERVPDWTVNVPEESETPPSITGDAVYVSGRDGRIRCLDRRDGTEKWSGGPFGQFGIPDRIKRTGREIFFGTKEGNIVVLDASSGSPVTRLEPFGERWRGKIITTEPNDAGIICARGGPNLAGVSIANRRVIWQSSSREYLDLPPIPFKNTVVLSKSSGEVVLLSLSTGSVVRSARVPGSLIQLGTVAGDSYIVVDTDGVINNVDLTDGEILWSYRAASSRLVRPTASENHVILHSEDGHFFGLDIARGTRAWEFQLTDTFPRPGVMAQGRFVVGSESGLVVCLNPESGSPYWTFKPEGRVALEPVADGRHLIVLGVDGTLSAFVMK